MSKRRSATPAKEPKDSIIVQGMNGAASNPEQVHPASTTKSPDPKLVAYVNDTRHFSYLRYSDRL